jgi:cellulose synthase (UDP-forming)
MKVAREPRLTRADTIVFTLLTCLSIAAIAHFAGRWFSFGDRLTHPTFLCLTFIVFFRIANSQARWSTLPFMRRPRPVTPRHGLRVAVVTTIVPEAEPLGMLEETLKALVALDYPHDTWVLDEDDDERVRALCRRNGALHFSRKNLAHYRAETGAFKLRTKHGNYNAWFHEVGFARYEIIAAFDPDHVAAPWFLSRVLGYFEDPSVGYVQAAQAYYNQTASFIARGAAEETYEYNSCTQMAAYGLGAPAIVGCHNTHRVRALREVNGFPAHDADDLLIGRLYRAHGWRGVYVPEILARGITPVDWHGYLTQQRRWARSVVDLTCRRDELLGAKRSVTARAVNAVHGLFYMQNSVTTAMSILLLVYMLTTGDVPRVVSGDTVPPLLTLCGALQLGAFYRQRFFLDPRREWGIHWRAGLLRYAKWPVFIAALWDVVSGRQGPYALTRKIKAESRSYLLLIPHLLVIVAVCASFGVGRFLGRSASSLMEWVAVTVVTASLGLILTDLWRFATPYDPRLLLSWRYGEIEVSRPSHPDTERTGL